MAGSVYCNPSEFVAAALRDNWFVASSAGGNSVLLKELIQLIGSYFCVDCTFLRPPPLSHRAQSSFCFVSLTVWCDDVCASCLVVFEWEDVDQSSAPQPNWWDTDPPPGPPVYLVRKDELLDLWTILDARTDREVVEWYAAWSRTTLGGSDFESHRASTGTTNTTRRRSFGIRISTESSSMLSGLSIGVTAASRDQLKLIAAPTWGCAKTDFVLTSSMRHNFSLSWFDVGIPGMCGLSNGRRETPLLSVAPKPTAAQEKADATGSGFLKAAPAIVTVGVVCDFDRNSLIFYVDDQVVQNTRLSFSDNSLIIMDDSNAGAPNPFEWLIPNAAADLRACRVYLVMWLPKFTAEFVHWTPPPPPPSPPPQPPQLANT